MNKVFIITALLNEIHVNKYALLSLRKRGIGTLMARITCLILCLLSFTAGGTELNPISARLVYDDNGPVLKMSATEGEVVYAKDLKIEVNNGVGKPILPLPRTFKFTDELVTGYSGKIIIPISLQNVSRNTSVSVYFKGCNIEKKVCYPPKKLTLPIDFNSLFAWSGLEQPSSFYSASSVQDLKQSFRSAYRNNSLVVLVSNSHSDCMGCLDYLKETFLSSGNFTFISLTDDLSTQLGLKNGGGLMLHALTSSFSVFSSKESIKESVQIVHWLNSITNNLLGGSHA